jgi:hypothetical protein
MTKYLGRYLNFGAQFLKIILFQRKIKYEINGVVENKTDYLIIQHALKIQYIFLLPKYIR